MHTLNHELEQVVLNADGRYLNSQELQPLEDYAQNYVTRLHTYQQLRETGEQIVLQTLRKLAQTYPELIQQYGSRCKYDMDEVLRYIALSVLRDDETFFKEQMVVWLDTILLAYKRNTHCGTAYRYLQDAIATTLPAADTTLVRPYLDNIIQMLQSHA
jgi:hypothetical protein